MQQQQVEAWLRQLGTSPASRPSLEGNDWQLQFIFPPGSQQTMACFAPRVPTGSTVISVNYPLSGVETTYDLLSEIQRNELLQELRLVLSRNHLYHDIAPGAKPGACPRSFAVFDMRFDDGLTLDSFARSIITVSNAALAANLCWARHLSSATRSAAAPSKVQ